MYLFKDSQSGCPFLVPAEQAVFFLWQSIRLFFLLKPRILSASQTKNPRLSRSASFICCIISGGSSPMRSRMRLLSMVRICSNSTTESRGRGVVSLCSSMCGGSLALVSLLVVAAALSSAKSRKSEPAQRQRKEKDCVLPK